MPQIAVRASMSSKGVTRTGGWSDVTVVDADGNRIPWTDVSHIGDDEMRDPMRDIVNRLYTFHLRADEPGLEAEIEKWLAVAGKWDEPEVDQRLIGRRSTQPAPEGSDPYAITG